MFASFNIIAPKLLILQSYQGSTLPKYLARVNLFSSTVVVS